MGKRSTISIRKNSKMVKGNNKLAKLFHEQPKIIQQFLLSSSNMSIILLDHNGIILDCNEFFLGSIQLLQKPVGKSIDNFVHHGLKHIKNNVSDEISHAFKLTFSLEDSSHYTTRSHIVKIDEQHFVIFSHALHLTHSESIVAMSKLTNELTDITRELNKKNKQLEIANEKITKLMNTDPLTGLANRRHLTQTLKYEISKSIAINAH